MKILNSLVQPIKDKPRFRLAPALTRHSARELALQILFQIDFHGAISGWLEEFWAEQRPSQAVREFADHLVDGVQAQKAELDQLIKQFSENWTLDRMPIIDRNILRQAIYELLWLPDIPAKVTLDEALQLAKSFADDDAKKFVNGILDKILKHDPRLKAKRAVLS